LAEVFLGDNIIQKFLFSEEKNLVVSNRSIGFIETLGALLNAITDVDLIMLCFKYLD